MEAIKEGIICKNCNIVDDQISAMQERNILVRCSNRYNSKFKPIYSVSEKLKSKYLPECLKM